MTARSLRSLLQTISPTIYSVKQGTGSIRGTLLVQGAAWEQKEAVRIAASQISGQPVIVTTL